MRRGLERAMLGRGTPVRLAQTLAKAGVILAVIAVALGGAVALGSTLFEAPPRDAAEFAARIEAGARTRPPHKRSTRSSAALHPRAVSDLCADRNERLRDLETRGLRGRPRRPAPGLADDPRRLLRGLRGARLRPTTTGDGAPGPPTSPGHARPRRRRPRSAAARATARPSRRRLRGEQLLRRRATIEAVSPPRRARLRDAASRRLGVATGPLSGSTAGRCIAFGPTPQRRKP